MALEYQSYNDQKNVATYSKHGFDQIDAQTKEKHAAWYISSRVLSTKRHKDVKWNWKDFENMKKGQNGWYLQTTYAKVVNLIKKNLTIDEHDAYGQLHTLDDDDYASFIDKPEWEQLMKHVIKYKSVREKSIEEMETMPLFQFSIRLAQLVRKAIVTDDKMIDLKSQRERDARLVLFIHVKRMLYDAQYLMGYEASDQF